jgi:branched-chain amino acid transport system substrate-binding protein
MSPRVPVDGWTRFEAAQEWLNRNNYTTAAGGTAAAAIVESPRGGNQPVSRDDPMYREFLEWRANRQKANR